MDFAQRLAEKRWVAPAWPEQYGGLDWSYIEQMIFAEEMAYAAGAQPAVKEQLVAFRSRPEFRMVELSGVPMIDVSQTPFPDQWRDLPVYQWDTGTSFRMEERMRGMGVQSKFHCRPRR